MERESNRRSDGRPPTIVFDGVCNLCNGFVRFVLARDRGQLFRFLPLQSVPAAHRARLMGAGEPVPGTSVLLITGDRVYAKSAAVLRIVGAFGGLWRVARLALLVPRPLRDAAYDIIARHRYRIFGRRADCMVPDDDARARFLAELPDPDRPRKLAI